MRLTTMAKKQKRPLTLTELLREELAQAASLREVARATGTHHATLLRFLREDQTLRLDAADALARHFSIEHVRKGGE